MNKSFNKTSRVSRAKRILSLSKECEVEGLSIMQYVYMIKDDTGKLYVGISENPDSRLKEHNTERGSIFTESGNFKIVFNIVRLK